MASRYSTGSVEEVPFAAKTRHSNWKIFEYIFKHSETPTGILPRGFTLDPYADYIDMVCTHRCRHGHAHDVDTCRGSTSWVFISVCVWLMLRLLPENTEPSAP